MNPPFHETGLHAIANQLHLSTLLRTIGIKQFLQLPRSFVMAMT
jgi:hypothetical protein